VIFQTDGVQDARMTRVAAPALLAVCLALAAGCTDDESAAPPATDATPAAETTAIAVYLLRDERIAAVRRRIAQTPRVARAAIEALLAGPTAGELAAGLVTAVPPGTTLRDVTVADGVATVDLSGAFDDGGGSASMLGRVAQVVATLTQFPTVRRVAFRLDGEPVKAIGGEGVAVDPPLGRGAIEEQTPQILVESPLTGDTVTSPVRVRGTANVFEATVSFAIRDATGATIHEAFTTATSGSGTRGTFDTQLSPPETTGPVSIVAFEASAEDGRPLHQVSVGVTLRG
jgi:hypothetical protein